VPADLDVAERCAFRAEYLQDGLAVRPAPTAERDDHWLPEKSAQILADQDVCRLPRAGGDADLDLGPHHLDDPGAQAKPHDAAGEATAERPQRAVGSHSRACALPGAKRHGEGPVTSGGQHSESLHGPVAVRKPASGSPGHGRGGPEEEIKYPLMRRYSSRRSLHSLWHAVPPARSLPKDCDATASATAGPQHGGLPEPGSYQTPGCRLPPALSWRC